MRGTPNSLTAAIATLTKARQENFGDIAAHAAIASLHQQAPLALDTSALERLMATLDEPTKTRLQMQIQNLQKASNEEACWAGRTLYAAASASDPKQQLALARLFVEP
jgi:uncharacterized protein (DUF1778 family)